MIIDLTTYTTIHTALSLVALASGIIVVIGLLVSQPSPIWNAIFLATAVATNATGFGFPFTTFLPSHGVALVALVVLVPTIIGYYGFGLSGAWRWIYAVGVVLSLYFDAFVAIAQAFMKIPALTALAPTGSEPPFAAAQGVTLVIFAVLAVLAVIRFHPQSVDAI